MSGTASPERPRLLAVGAFERDNFGDLLYGHLIEAATRDDFEISFAAPFASQIPSELSGGVRPWAPALRDERFDAVWVVGGEVGATPPEYAYLTAFGEQALDALRNLSPQERESALASSMGGVVLDPPYIPRPSAFALNAGAPLTVSSVGLSGIGTERDPARAAGLLGTVREATHVSVRDSASAAFLDSVGMPHSLAPDLAHTVATLHPVERVDGGPVVVHINDAAAHTVGIGEWARALHAALPDTTVPVILFLAGLAPAHDSEHAAEDLRAALHGLDPARRVTVSTARGVWDRVDEIAGASLYVGSSLHGRIIASAYGVPRVSLAKPKVDRYAQDWDPAMPSGVGVAWLDSAVAQALAAPAAARDDLAARASSALTAAVAATRASAHEQTADRIGSRLQARADEADLLRATLRVRAAREKAELRAQHGRLESLREEIRRERAERRERETPAAAESAPRRGLTARLFSAR